jgi:hypothetical protein
MTYALSRLGICGRCTSMKLQRLQSKFSASCKLTSGVHIPDIHVAFEIQ